jgi:vacuolar-type H+-ATPase subunit D/Vma8
MSKPKAAKHADKAADAPKTADRTLPSDRISLLELHQELRHRRDALPLLSEERAETVIEIARVEVQVARIERAMDPPLG